VAERIAADQGNQSNDSDDQAAGAYLLSLVKAASSRPGTATASATSAAPPQVTLPPPPKGIPQPPAVSLQSILKRACAEKGESS
jgi:hypothetical protein